MGFHWSGRTLAVAAMLMIAGLAATPVAATSFDCGKAKAPDEKAICASRTLSDLDVEMATLFRVRMQIPMLMGARGDAGDQQVTWLTARARCGANVACLTRAYRQRIADLRQTISDAMQDYCKRMGICG
jgi:uncharacterized protein